MLKIILLLIAGGIIHIGIEILLVSVKKFVNAFEKNETKEDINVVEFTILYIMFKTLGILMIAIPIILVIIFNK